jgi:mono/diheme cytochrome c family protein
MPDSRRTNDPEICFERDILPIFVSNCAMSNCHSQGSAEKGYVLDNYQNIMRKGIVPGNYAASKIYQSVAGGGGSWEDDEKMPKGLAPLNATQLDLLRRWIAAGAVDYGACTAACDSSNYTYSGAIAPLMQKYCVGCHNSASAAGGSFADYASVKASVNAGKLLGNIAHTAGFLAMPPTSLQLSSCEVAQVRQWIAAGAPNN